MRFDATDLRLFLNVAETRSLSRGAARSHLAIASASARIKAMEAAVGVPLLLRQRHGVTPTAAGEVLAAHARIILQQFEQMRGELGAHARGLRGQVRLLSNTAAATEHLPPLLAAYRAANDSVDISLEERESPQILEALVGGGADIGIVADVPEGWPLETSFFAHDRLVAVLPRGHDFAGRRRLSFAELAGADFIGLPEGSALQDHLARHARHLAAPLRVRLRLRSYEAIAQLVESGVGVAVMPERAARRCRRTRRLELARLTDAWASRRLSLCTPRAARLPAHARRLLDHLKRAAQPE
jgi:DNA-binding transcriptional LysR family regulator